MALEASDEEEKKLLLMAAKEGSVGESSVSLKEISDLYYKYEIHLQASMLADQQRERAMQAVQSVKHEGLQALFTFLTATLLE